MEGNDGNDCICGGDMSSNDDSGYDNLYGYLGTDTCYWYDYRDWFDPSPSCDTDHRDNVCGCNCP